MIAYAAVRGIHVVVSAVTANLYTVQIKLQKWKRIYNNRDSSGNAFFMTREASVFKVYC